MHSCVPSTSVTTPVFNWLEFRNTTTCARHHILCVLIDYQLELSTFRSPDTPVSFENLETDTSQVSPMLDKHTDEILSELGDNDKEIARFESDRVV